MSDVTQILNAIEHGDSPQAEQLLPLVYGELRKLAALRLAEEKPGQTLQATALVHEAYLRLVGGEQVENWNSRGHFFAAAAEAMRRILVENARRKKAEKHGGAWQRQEFLDAELAVDSTGDDLFAVDEALTRFAAEHPRAARLVHLHFSSARLWRKQPLTSAYRPALLIAIGPIPGPGFAANSTGWIKTPVRNRRISVRFRAQIVALNFGAGPRSAQPEGVPMVEQNLEQSIFLRRSSLSGRRTAGLSRRSLPRQPRTPSRIGRSSGCSQPAGQPFPVFQPGLRDQHFRAIDRIGGHGHRAVQTARADRRGRHGRSLDGPADRAGQTAAWP